MKLILYLLFFIIFYNYEDKLRIETDDEKIYNKLLFNENIVNSGICYENGIAEYYLILNFDSSLIAYETYK